MLCETRDGPIKLNFPNHDSMATMLSIVYVDSFEAQQKMQNMIRSMIAAGIMEEYPPIEIQMIELSTMNQTKSTAIMATHYPCSEGKKEK
jgi:hypothetical protein